MGKPQEAHFLLAIVDLGGNEDAAAIAAVAAAGIIADLIHLVD